MSANPQIVPDGWKPMTDFEDDHRCLVGCWVRKKVDGLTVEQFQVEVYDPCESEQLIWGDLEEYVAWLSLPDDIPVGGR
jgi:hypothetical protein